MFHLRIKFFTICIFYILLGCSHKVEYFEELNEQPISHDLALDVEIDYYMKGQLAFKLIAEEMQQMKDLGGKNIFPKGIKVEVYDQKLETTAIISSDFAIQNKPEKLVKASQNVILINSENEQLNTETLFWDGKEQKIYTDDFVTINTENEIIMGYGFITDESFSSYSLSDITGTVYL